MQNRQTVSIAGAEVDFVLCPSGKFVMGSDDGFPLEQPRRDVTIRRPFWISSTLVTQELWQVVMPDNHSEFRNSPRLPVENVSFDDACAFCNRVTELAGKRFSLPTEAQWEYACRAGTETEYFWGSSSAEATKFAWFELNAREQTQEVGKLKANPWDLYDMVGNLWEWCSDTWHDDYQDAPTTDEAWQDSLARPRRVLRGGAWDMDAFRLRSAYRSFDFRQLRTSRFGLRLTIILN
jgi:formylglycine-generating enzyme required for sulfatase activity